MCPKVICCLLNTHLRMDLYKSLVHLQCAVNSNGFQLWWAPYWLIPYYSHPPVSQIEVHMVNFLLTVDPSELVKQSQLKWFRLVNAIKRIWDSDRILLIVSTGKDGANKSATSPLFSRVYCANWRRRKSLLRGLWLYICQHFLALFWKHQSKREQRWLFL